MKRLFAALAASVMMIGSALTAHAAAELSPDGYYYSNDWASERMLPRLVDDADVLSDSDEERLLGKLDDISEYYGVDVVVLTVYSLEGKDPERFAEDYLAYNGFGQGDTHDCFVFMLSMEYRDWAISVAGAGDDIMNSYGREYVFERMRNDLSHDRFYYALDEYADVSEMFIQEWEKGTPYSSSHPVREPLPFYWIFIALGGGALVGFIYSHSIKSQLTSVKMQRGADAYIRPNSFRVTGSRDTYLYSKETRHRIESSGGGGGGRSSVHHSSHSSSGKF